ncbi:MAG: hypothetical protein IPM12_10425 [Flavobacteriales bacterium]|nr:hypothetical protein [Flavobacteriales bacterium]
MSTTTASTTKARIGDLHFDHMEWINSLGFYKDEISIFEHRLEDIVRRNTKQEVMAELEHFQNQFIREKEVIDELRHDIKQAENELERESKDHPVAIDHRWFADHTSLRERFLTFEKLHRDLKGEFHQWLVKRM